MALCPLGEKEVDMKAGFKPTGKQQQHFSDSADISDSEPCGHSDLSSRISFHSAQRQADSSSVQ